MSKVTVKIIDHIAHVTLNRPDKMNAVDSDVMTGLIKAGQSLLDADIRAVVLSGAGPSFCAGLDVMSFSQLAQSDPETIFMPRTHGTRNEFQETAMIWRQLPVPVIAALHGAVLGAGFQIALGTDIRIAAPDSKFAIMEMKWGLIPDMGGMVILPKLTRSDVIRYLTYTATPIGAQQASDWGLVTELHDDPLARANELAQEIVGKSPSAIRAAKSLITFAESSDSEADILLAESRAQTDLIGKPHQLEVIAANMAKRPAKFE